MKSLNYDIKQGSRADVLQYDFCEFCLFIDLDCGLGLTPDQAEQIAFLLYDGAIFDEVFRAENKYGGNIADRSIISGIMQYRGYDLFGRNLFYNGESCYDLQDMEIGSFFAITTSLSEANILKPTKEVVKD